MQPHHRHRHHHYVMNDQTQHYPVHNHLLSDKSTVQAIPQPHRHITYEHYPFSSNPSHHISSCSGPISPSLQTYTQCEASQLNRHLSSILQITCEKLLKNQLKLPLLHSMLLTFACTRIQGAKDIFKMVRALVENKDQKSTTIEVTITTTSNPDQKINDAPLDKFLLPDEPKTVSDDDIQNDEVEGSHSLIPSSPSETKSDPPIVSELQQIQRPHHKSIPFRMNPNYYIEPLSESALNAFDTSI
ncbi:hypothetical protein F8M41_025522 [Gigaspora margarita]|uniref:Uncharacterized protein n=1 Tax=Gigaspora margarita TaxID=4874 RepID=A0A8H4AB53_GIGMA|nr:hypothetical protein F8M41_025522 [Gigaspora margarita]